jgi:hypothetical protein
MAFADLSGPAMASAIMRNDAIPALKEEQHLPIPIVGRKRPAMAEHDWLALAPVFVKNLDAVFCLNHAHLITIPGFFSKLTMSVTLRMRCGGLPFLDRLAVL